MTTTSSTLPRWDMTSIFPALESPEFQQAHDQAVEAIAALVALFDHHGVSAGAELQPAELVAPVLEEVIERFNAVQSEMRTLGAYAFCLVMADARDDAAQAALSDLKQHEVAINKLNTRLTAWVAALPIDDLAGRSNTIREHLYPLRQMQRNAAHLMSPDEENLAADLSLSGSMAWSKLQGDLSAQIMVPIEIDGEIQQRPLSEVELLAFNPDRAVRQRAHAAEICGWEGVSTPVAAALNGVKGETNTLTTRRGWTDPLEAALFVNRIDQETLDALISAIRDALPDLHRVFRAKARALGLPHLATYDRWAPIGVMREWPFDEAVRFLIEQFSGYSPKLGDLAERAFREQWVDAEPREGKSGGAMCISVTPDVSRVFANYTPAYDSMSALAHELGHAYHNLIFGERQRTPLQDPFPGAMTLAETASTFCETLVNRAIRARSDEAEELAILDGSLQVVCLNVFDAIAMYRMEHDLFIARRKRELSASELNELALNALRDIYGDAVDQETFFTYQWARLPHFYIPDLWFYNFPYAFGMLFGLGLFARYEADPESFIDAFDDLLSETGMADAADLGDRFGINIRTPDFWRDGLAMVRADIDRYEELISALAPAESAA